MCNYPLSFFRFYDGTTKICPTGTKEIIYKGIKYSDYQLVPCGKCIECRLNYARQWTFRIQAELLYHDKSSFITLTYDNDHVPMSDSGALTLVKSDFQKFIKRLRKHLKGEKIMYYACGEYGENTLRPHYHAIIFGWCPDDLLFHKINYRGDTLFTSETLSNLWPFGFSLIAPANARTGGYCARYVTKKFSGAIANDLYFSNGIIAPFSLSSKRPAIGLQYFYDHIDDFINYQKISLPTSEGSLTISPPKYFFDKLAIVFPEKYAIIKDSNSELAKLSESLSSIIMPSIADRLQYDYKEDVSIMRVKSLKRGGVDC